MHGANMKTGICCGFFLTVVRSYDKMQHSGSVLGYNFGNNYRTRLIIESQGGGGAGDRFPAPLTTNFVRTCMVVVLQERLRKSTMNLSGK